MLQTVSTFYGGQGSGNTSGWSPDSKRIIWSVYEKRTEPRWNWHGPFLRGSSPPGCARIATTPATVRQALGAAIVPDPATSLTCASHSHTYARRTRWGDLAPGGTIFPVK